MRQCVPVLVTLASLVTPTVLYAQDKPKGVAEFNEFNAKERDGWKWDEDDRLNDLIAQLQEKELALQEVDARTAKLLGRKAGTKMDGNMAWRAVDRMDLNGGGPIRWDAFYGRNAEKFFYHPVDPNTTYHTTTALQQVQPTQVGGVPGNQGVPAHQRPPQFDYIYRGYERRQEKAKADAKEIEYKVDSLKERRKQLEREVVLLWVKIAFRVLDREKVAEKPILRWAAVPQEAGKKEDTDRAMALTEATQLLAAALLFNEKRVESEPDQVFRTVSDAIEKNRKKFEDSLLRTTTLQGEAADKKKPLGQYKLLARRLEDISKSLSEGYVGWKDGDESDDEPTKFTGLRRVQDSVVNYSQILLALNELVDVMSKEWGLQINTEGTEFTPTWDVVYAARPTPRPDPVKKPTEIAVVRELGTANHPWLSSDGLTIYYTIKGSPETVAQGQAPTLWMANRENADSMFRNMKEVGLGLDCTISEDGLEGIVFLPMGKGSLQIMRRSSVKTAFGRPTLIKELETAFLASPQLAADGLTLYYEKIGLGPFFSTRRSRTGRWSQPEKVPSSIGAGGQQRFPYITEEGLGMLCTDRTRDGAIAYYSRAKMSDPFEMRGYVTVLGERIAGNFPRHVSATNELFFVKLYEGRTELHVVRNFDLSRGVHH